MRSRFANPLAFFATLGTSYVFSGWPEPRVQGFTDASRSGSLHKASQQTWEMHTLHVSWALNQILTQWDLFCLHCGKCISLRGAEKCYGWAPALQPQPGSHHRVGLGWAVESAGHGPQAEGPARAPPCTRTVAISFSFGKMGLVKGQSW